jgi:hypothetical protein
MESVVSFLPYGGVRKGELDVMIMRMKTSATAKSRESTSNDGSIKRLFQETHWRDFGVSGIQKPTIHDCICPE